MRKSISSEEDPGDDDNVHVEPNPKAVKGAPRFVVAGPANGGVKMINAKVARTEANRRGAAYQNNLVAMQQTLEDMYLHTARVRYHYRNCLEMGGPILKKKGQSGRVEARDLWETLVFALCCVVNVPFVNRPFESEIHGTVNFTYFCCVLLVTWCHPVLLLCYLRPK